MKIKSNLIIRMIHFAGPLKGTEQEFAQDEISIGRSRKCDVIYPPDITEIGRNHAKIIREGNRFKLVDNNSANGTFVNGKKEKEIWLENGNTLTIATAAKIGFYIEEKEGTHQSAPLSSSDAKPQAILVHSRPKPEPTVSVEPVTPPTNVKNIKAPLDIQYGPTLRHYNELPVTIGKNPACKCVISLPFIYDRHAMIFFFKEQYWIKDMTGRNLILINGQPIQGELTIEPNSRVSLTPRGPHFRFLSGGFLAEIEDAVSAKSQKEEIPKQKIIKDTKQKNQSMLGKILKKY